MTGPEMQSVRERMGLTRRELAILLGYSHANPDNDYTTVKRMEIGQRDISPMCARLLTLIYRHWTSTGNLPEFEEA